MDILVYLAAVTKFFNKIFFTRKKSHFPLENKTKVPNGLGDVKKTREPQTRFQYGWKYFLKSTYSPMVLGKILNGLIE